MFILLFLIGIFIGSFLGVIILRLLMHEQFISGRSYCRQCKKELVWYDLIPIVSFLVLRGKCRYCKKPIGIFHPIVELTTGVLFTITGFSLLQQELITNTLTFFFILLFSLFITSVFTVIFFTDLLGGYIFDKVVYPAIGITALYLVFLYPEKFFTHFITACCIFLLFFALFFLTKGKGIGFGDVKLVFLIGLLLGFPQIVPALYIACISGVVIGVGVSLIKKRRLRGATIPFGPFLVTGAFIIYSLGNVDFLFLGLVNK